MSATPANSRSPRGFRAHLALVGPGLVLAATGVGAGDLVAASVAGSRYGFALVWAAALGAILKFALSEGLARWQLATGTTLFEGWALHLGAWVSYVFLGYLVIWSFVVGGALISACGIAAHALAPGLSVATWGVIHSLVAALVVLVGGYRPFEQLIKLFVGVMFVALVGCALLVDSPATTLAAAVSGAALPKGSVAYTMSVLGGVGGSVTLLSYGYWIREKRWVGREWLSMVRFDLAIAYGLTGIFGIAVVALAATVLYAGGVELGGTSPVLLMADMLRSVLGPAGHWIFLVGFWGAVASSILGVWQGIPYLFCDFISTRSGAVDETSLSPRSLPYVAALAWLALPTLSLLHYAKPVPVIIAYAVLGALFMPFLAATLLYMNRRVEWVGELRNGRASSWLTVLCLVLFGILAVLKLIETV